MLKASLRERKFAITKQRLLNEAVDRIRDRPLSEISVKELCEAAQVSEATFFNYFPRKTDLLVYYTQLWELKLCWHAWQMARTHSAIEIINELFLISARQIENEPELMTEIISYLGGLRQPLEYDALTYAERKLAYGEFANIENIKSDSIFTIFTPLLGQAVENGELPEGADPKTLQLLLNSILFGAPFMLAASHPQGIQDLYRYHLDTLWAGVRSRQPVLVLD